MKLYIDWNVLNGIKNGRFEELEQIIRQPEKFVIIYSPSHVTDIGSSYSEKNENPEIQSDLEFLADLTNCMCVFNNGNDIVLQQNEPFHIFEDEIESKNLTDDFSFNKILSMLDDDGGNSEMVAPLKTMLQSFPVDNIFKEAFENPQSAEIMNALFPGLKDNPTFEGLFDGMGKMLENLNEKEGYKDLKSPFQYLNINTGKLTNPSNNPFDVLNETYKKLGVEESPLKKDYFEKGKHGPIWFDDIVSAYINLDMHGFHSDEIKVTERKKKTFKNTTQDAFHTAFASTCDFYITNDKKNYLKAKATFKEKNLYTYVLKADEFIKFYKENLEKVDFTASWQKFIEVTKSGFFHDISDKDNTNDFNKVHLSTFNYFGYFNRIHLYNFDDKRKTINIMFGRELPTNC